MQKGIQLFDFEMGREDNATHLEISLLDFFFQKKKKKKKFH